MSRLLRVLVVEDSEDDTTLLSRELRRGGYEPIIERVDTERSMRAALAQQEWDVVLADHTLPSFSGPAALALLQELGLDLPFIIVSGAIGEEVAVAAMKAGAHDFVRKGRLFRLIPAIEREMREAAGRRERRRAEAALRESEERYRTLVDSVDDIVHFKDTQARYVMVNAEMLRRFKWRPEDIIGKTALEVFPPEVAHKVLADDWRVLQSGAVVDTVEEYATARGRRSFHVRKVPLRNEVGAVVGIVTISRDITERQQLEETKLKMAREQSARDEAERLKGEFLLLVSHEFRTPLTVVLGNLDLARQRLGPVTGNVAREVVDRVEKAREAAWRVSAMVEGLLDVTAIEVGKLELIAEPVFLPRVLREVLARLQPVTWRHQVKLQVPEDFPLVRADRRRVAQVLSNLITNAVKYTAPGTEIVVQLEPKATEVEVSVADRGAGIPAAELPRLFDRFHRLQAPDLGLREGLGLGLYVNKAVVEAHGGRMWAESEVGQGSTFYFTLPVT